MLNQFIIKPPEGWVQIVATMIIYFFLSIPLGIIAIFFINRNMKKLLKLSSYEKLHGEDFERALIEGILEQRLIAIKNSIEEIEKSGE